MTAFPRYLTIRIIVRAAASIVAVAVGWQIYDLTRSTTMLALVGLAQFLSQLLLTLPSGHVADRQDRRLLCVLCYAAAGLTLAGLTLGSLHGIGTAAIFATITLVTALRISATPALVALLPHHVPAGDLPRATALVSSLSQAGGILGPAIGGLLYALGPAVPYAVAAAMFLAAAALNASLPSPGRPKSQPAGVADVFAGIAFIRRHQVILGAVSLDLFAVLLGGATALMPVYARDILHAGPGGLGLLRAAPAMGATAFSLVLARWPLVRRVGRHMFQGVFAFGLLTIVFGVSRSLPVSILALAAMGAADVVSVTVRQSLVQLETPDAIRGRVNAANSLFIGTSNQLGEFESGITASLVGTVPAVVLGGIGTVAVAALWMRWFPALHRADRYRAA